MANNNAYDELNKLINDIVATGRVESSSGKAQQGSSGSGQSAGGQSSVQVGTPEYFAQRRSALGITNRTIDSNYIGKFIADANKFSRDGVSANVRMGYSTSKNIYNERKSQADELRSRSFAIDRFLDQNKDSIDQKTYEDLKGYIKSFGEYSANSVYSMYRTNQFYSQFKDEADYNKYVAEQERYQKLSTMDLRQAEDEIRKLESDRDNFIWNTEYDASDHNQRVQFQNALRQQEAEISQRRAELRQAKNIQEGITLSNASNNEDFSQYSGYRSTKQDGFLNGITSDLQLGYRDLQYEYINNQNGIRDEIDTLAMANGQAGNHQYRQKGYDQLKPDEVAIYNYYYAKEGSKKAQQYLDNLQETLNHRMATGMYEPIEDKLALELAFGVAAGLDQFASGVKSFLNNEDDYIAPSAYQMASAMVREDLADVGKKLPDWLGGGSVGQGAYDAVTTISNMAPSIAGSTIASVLAPGIGLPAAISKYAGAAVGNGLMFASSAGNAYQEALNSGFDKGQARAYSTLVGASEAGLQYLLGGITSMGGVISGGVTEQILKGVDNALARTAIQIGGNMISEGVEEGLQEILTPWFKNLTLHVNENVNWSEVAYSTLLGALTAGIMEGPSTAGQEINTYRSGKKLMGMDGGAERIAQIGNTFSADTVAYKLAGKVNEKTGAYTIGKLFNEIDATITEQNKNDITRALMAEGMTKEIASKNAEVLQFIADGGQVSDIQMRMIEKNDVLAKVAREVLIDENSTYNQRMRGYNEAVNQLNQPKKKSQHTNQENSNQAAQKEHEAAEEAVDMQADDVSIEGKDIRKSDSTAVNIEGISEIKNGEVTLRLDDGSTINSKDVSFASEMDAVVYNTLSSMDISTRAGQILLDGYNTAKQNGNLSAGEYALGISEAFRYGQQGIPYKEISRSPFASKLNIGQQEFLYKQGMRAAGKVAAKKQAEASKYRGTETGKRKGTVHSDIDIKTLNQRQQASIAGLKAVADAIGVDFYLFESKVVGGKRRGANGWYDPKDSSIHIDIYAGQNGEGTILFTASHELTHFIRQWSPAKFKTLANFVLKQYGDNGVSVSELIAKQISKAAENGRTIDSDTAYEEVVADSMESMLADPDFMERIAELKKQDRSLVEKIHDFLKDFASKIRAAYEGLNPDSEEGRIVSEMADSIETIRDMFAEALVDAGENYSSSLMPGKDSVVVDDSGDPVAMSTEDGSVVLSLRTYEESGRTELRKYLEKCVSSNKLTKADMQEMLDGIEEIYKVCSQFKDKYAPFGRWSDAAVVRDTYGRPVFSVVTPNGEYKMNLDFSLVCKKRRTLDAVFNEMSRRGIIDDFELGQKSVVKINEIIRRYGLETACALCFVDAKRFRQAAMADSFTGLYNELVYSLVPEDQRGSIDHFNFSGNEKVKKVEGGIDTWDSSRLDFTHLNEVMQNYEKGTVEYKAAKYIKTHAEGRKLLMRGDFMSSSGFDTVKSKNKDILKLYNAKKGTGGPKAAFGDVQYLNEIIKKARTWTPEKAYAVGGVRIQSFSDYVPRMVFDYTQMIYDLAATKLPAHAYTKEAMFAMQFGLTGVKINMSLIPAVVDGGIAPGLDANGNYVWAGESFDYEIAKKIQNADGYTENCGTICVGVSYQHILKLLGDPNIRMIIPYHKSGLNPIVAHMNKIAEFTDYTSLKTNPGGCQNTMDKNGSKVEKDFSFNESLIKTGDPKATAREYLNWCAEHGYTPRFAEFAWHENYYKLLEDFTLYDKDGNYVPQREVRAVFPKAENAFGSMKDLIQAGLEEDAVIEGKRDRSLGAIVDEIQKILPRTEAEIEEKQVAQADRDLEAAIRGIEEDVHTDDVNAIQEQISDVVNTLKFSDRGASKRTETYSAIGKELLTYEEGNQKPDLTLVQVVNDRTGKTETTIKHFGQKPKDYIPKKIAYCYKLFEQHPDGTLHALFAGAKGETPIGVWQYAQGFPYTDSGVKGMNLRERYGWHLSAGLPAAPHLMSPKDFSRGYPSKNAYGHPKGSKRVWVRMAYDATTDFNAIADSTKSGDIFGLIPFGGYYAFKENNQSEWVISSAVKIDKILTEEERQEILRNAGYNEYEEWRKKHHATDAEKAESKRRSVENKKAKDLAAKEGKNYLSESAKEMREAIKSRIIDNPELSEDMDNTSIRYQDRYGDVKQASQLTESDFMDLLEKVENRDLNERTYIPMRATTPQFFCDVVREHSKGKVNPQNLPMASLVDHVIQNMEEEDGRSYGAKRPHGLSKNDIVTIAKEMGHPAYIVKQNNGRYAEVVSFYNSQKRKVIVSVDFATENNNYKYEMYMNGYNSGYYNIIVTQYEPDSLAKYLKGCVIVYDKQKMNGKYQVGSGRVVTVTHDTPFIKDTVSQNDPGVNPNSETGSSLNGNDGILLQDRRNGGLSNRTLLANALETAAQNDIERKRLAEYKESIELINGEEQKLRTIRKQIKSATDPDTVKELYAEAAKVANRISVYDGKLLRLEASKPLKDLLSREQKAAYDRGVKQGKAALDAYKERMEKNQQELVDRYRDARKRSIDDRQKAEIKQKIRKTIRDLDGILNRGSKKRNVKEGMKGLVDTAIKSAEILFTDSYTNEDLIRNGIETQMTPEELKLLNEARAIMDELDNLPTGYDGYLARKEKEDALRGRLSYRMGKLKDVFVRERARLNQTTVSSVLGELADAYGSMQSSELPHIQGAYHENVHEYLKMLQEDIGGTIIKDMTRDQLEELYKAYTMVKTTVFNANRMFAENLNNTRDALASMVMDEVKKVGGIHGPWSKAENSVNTFVWNNEKPVYAFERIGSKTLSAMYANIRKGQDTWAVDLQEANDFRKEMYRKFNRNGWDLLKGYKFTSSTGLEFELNLDQIMSLYAYSKRAQAHDHLLKGGFVFDGSTETIINKHGVNLKYLVKDATAYNLSYEILENIISNLTPEQKAFVDAMQDYLSTTMGQKGNDVSMKLYGVKLFNEKFYFPLRSAGQYMERAKEADMKKQQGQISISNSGFSKAVKEKASNPVVLSGFMDVWASHVNEMSMYHSFVLPMEDFRRVWNYSSPHEEGTQSASVNGVVENAYGKAAVEYIDRLYRDLNGGAITDNTAGVINKMMNLFKKGAVFASASVTIQQPSAIARATALIDPKYFVGEKISAGKHSEVWAEVKKYAPVAIIKEMGFFDTNMGRSATDFLTSEEYTGIKEKAEAIVKDGDYRDEMLSKAPALADELTWCVIWNAVKRETKARNPGMDIRSDAFLQECGERFSEVIDKTQVYDSVLARSANMRSKDTGMKMATAFMAEPTTSINMIEDAFRKAKRGDKKYARRAIGSVVASMILNSFLVSWVYAARDDDDEKSFMEKYVNQFAAGIVDGINPMTYIPFLKDIVSIVQGYEVERSDMSVISDLWNAIQKLKRDDVSTYRKVEDFAGSICQIFGLPVKNIMRDVRSAYQAWDTVANGEKTTKAGLVYAAKEDLPLFGGKVSNMDQLYEARKAGDTEHAARVEERYIRNNDGDREEGMKSANAAVRTSIKNRYMEGKLDGSQAYTELLMIANEDPKEISWLIDEWNYNRETGKYDYNKFNAFYEAVRTGKNLKATIQTYTERDVEWATLKGQITEKFKPEYLEMSASERAGIKGYLINALTQLGTTREDAENTLRDWDFEAKYGMTYSDMKKGFEEGTIDQSTMESGMKDMGMKNYEIAEQMRKMTDGNSFFKKYGSSKSEYKKSYLEGRISREQYIDSLVYDGKTEAEAEEAVRTLDIEKRFGIEYGKLDDAYKYGDISREDLKGAIIENGETPEKAEQAVQCYDWLKERVYEHPDLEIADARRFVIKIGQYSDKTLTDYGVSVEAYKQYTILKRDVHGVDANNDGKTDSGTYRDALFEMIDELPISSEAKTGLALISYSEKTIRRKAPWR